MKHKTVWLGVVAILSVALGVLAYRYVRHEAALVANRTCVNCTVDFAKMRIDWVNGHIHFTDLLLVVGRDTKLEIVAQIPLLIIDPEWLSLWVGEMALSEIIAERPKVTLRERDKVRDPSDESGAGGMGKFAVRSIVVREGEFIYEDHGDKRMARLALGRIDLKIQGFKTSGETGTISGEAQGLLENSGTFHLDVTTEPFLVNPKVVVKLQVENQDLSRVNPFFLPDSGVQLEGTLLKGNTRVEMKGDSLKSWATVVYEGLNVGLRSVGDDMGTLEAAIGSLFADITLATDSQRGDKDFAVGEAELQRDPKRSVVSFLLSGMKEAAMVAAKKPMDPTSHGLPRSPGP